MRLAPVEHWQFQQASPLLLQVNLLGVGVHVPLQDGLLPAHVDELHLLHPVLFALLRLPNVLLQALDYALLQQYADALLPVEHASGRVVLVLDAQRLRVLNGWKLLLDDGDGFRRWQVYGQSLSLHYQNLAPLSLNEGLQGSYLAEPKP